MKKEKTTSIAEKFVYETNAIFPPFCDLRIRKAGAYQRLLTSKYFLGSMRKQNAHLPHLLTQVYKFKIEEGGGGVGVGAQSCNGLAYHPLRNRDTPGARFSKLPVITWPVKLFCFPLRMGVSKGLKIVH